MMLSTSDKCPFCGADAYSPEHSRRLLEEIYKWPLSAVEKVPAARLVPMGCLVALVHHIELTGDLDHLRMRMRQLMDGELFKSSSDWPEFINV